jgi:hypothetical protein
VRKTFDLLARERLGRIGYDQNGQASELGEAASFLKCRTPLFDVG